MVVKLGRNFEYLDTRPKKEHSPAASVGGEAFWMASKGQEE